MPSKFKRIAFQGAHGAYSDVAARAALPGIETVPYASFDEAFAAVAKGQTDLAMIPVDNTLAGRVADVHRLMPENDLFIIGEYFLPVRHHLMGVKGAKLPDIKYAHSHVHAIPQCRKALARLKLKPLVHADTAGAAKDIAAMGDKAHGAIASELAAKTYGLKILARDVHDAHHNTTRFLILSRKAEIPTVKQEAILTSLIFGVRHIPAALYKAMGGFATNGVNMVKLESYVDENFQAAQFYCEVEGHPYDRAMRQSLEELEFYAKDVKFLGAYPAHPCRKMYAEDAEKSRVKTAIKV